MTRVSPPPPCSRWSLCCPRAPEIEAGEGRMVAQVAGHGLHRLVVQAVACEVQLREGRKGLQRWGGRKEVDGCGWGWLGGRVNPLLGVQPPLLYLFGPMPEQKPTPGAPQTGSKKAGRMCVGGLTPQMSLQLHKWRTFAFAPPLIPEETFCMLWRQSWASTIKADWVSNRLHCGEGVGEEGGWCAGG